MPGIAERSGRSLHRWKDACSQISCRGCGIHSQHMLDACCRGLLSGRGRPQSSLLQGLVDLISRQGRPPSPLIILIYIHESGASYSIFYCVYCGLCALLSSVSIYCFNQRLCRATLVLTTYPPAQNRYMQEKNLEELFFARIHVGPVFALVRIQENIVEELFLKYVFALWLCIDIVPVFAHPWCQYINYFGGINFGANTCGTCIHTRANTGKYFWRIIYVLVSCQGVFWGHPDCKCRGGWLPWFSSLSLLSQ